jgi:uncharacterized protein (DUF2336 family)
MNGTASLLQELEESISQCSTERRPCALRHATDILIAGRSSEEDIWVFGEVVERLARELEVEVRAQLSRRVSNSKNAPTNLVNQLASDNSMAVAGAVLRRSERFDTTRRIFFRCSNSIRTH